MIPDIPWSATRELLRQSEFEQDITPSLFHFWCGSPTDDLIDCRAELARKLPIDCADTIAALDLEIAFRTKERP